MGITHMEGDRRRSLGEEIANSVSHGVGLLAALVAVPCLLAAAVRHGDAQTVAAAGVFGVTVVTLYLASTLYHAFPTGRTKRVFEVLDNASIYLLIAGTYTPFTLGLIRGTWGWSLFAVIWALAAAGVVLAAAGGLKYPVLTVGLCLGMGWLVVVALRPLLQIMPPAGLLLIFGGGVAYTAGVAFFAARGLRYHHLIWHVFVLAGTCSHFMAIYLYAT